MVDSPLEHVLGSFHIAVELAGVRMVTPLHAFTEYAREKDKHWHIAYVCAQMPKALPAAEEYENYDSSSESQPISCGPLSSCAIIAKCLQIHMCIVIAIQ